MTIKISDHARQQAIASIQRYFQEDLTDEIGNLAAGALLNFFLEDIAPIVYNKAVSDVQQRMEARIIELNSEIFVDEFQYWSRRDRQKKPR